MWPNVDDICSHAAAVASEDTGASSNLYVVRVCVTSVGAGMRSFAYADLSDAATPVAYICILCVESRHTNIACVRSS